MNPKLLRTALLALALVASPSAFADDERKPPSDTQSDTTQSDTTKATPPPSGRTTASDMDQKQDTTAQGTMTDPKIAAGAKSKLSTAEVMKITQTAMVHIAAADKALDKGNTKAAKAALAKSEKSLSRLYNAPPLKQLLTEFDEAMADEKLNLAPLSASVTSYQAYVDPSVRAGIDEARERAEKGDKEGAQESLRLARNRVALDVAFVPVEDAYVRVLAAQQSLQKGNRKQASRLLEGVPIVVSEVQISQPLVPVRFKLHAAAEAADTQQWDRVQQLLSEVDQEMEQLEQVGGNTEMNKELTSIADEIERLHQQAIAGTNPKPDQIRELAKRTRDIGMEDDDRG